MPMNINAGAFFCERNLIINTTMQRLSLDAFISRCLVLRLKSGRVENKVQPHLPQLIYSTLVMVPGPCLRDERLSLTCHLAKLAVWRAAWILWEGLLAAFLCFPQT